MKYRRKFNNNNCEKLINLIIKNRLNLSIISEKLGFSAPDIKSLVNYTIREYGVPICSSVSSNDSGYYIPRTEEEIEKSIKTLYNSLYTLKKRIKLMENYKNSLR